MSGILGVFGSDSATLSARDLQRMVDRLARRGSAYVAPWREGDTALAATRHAWELAPGFSGDVLVLEDGDCVVVADATLYYREDLARRMDRCGTVAAGSTPSHFIAAAYRTWGDACPAELEGDFAFVLWDRRNRRVLAARDPAGTRPLFFAVFGDQLIVASTIDSIASHPSCSRDLDLTALAVDAGALVFAIDDSTAYRSIRRLNGGWTLSRGSVGAVRVTPHWSPPVGAAPSPRSFDEGAQALLELLSNSVAERVAPEGPTSIWLSGGWDSTAVFGAAQKLKTEGRVRHQLIPLSIALSRDDPMCETDRIEAVAARWQSEVRWLQDDQLPILDAPEERARARAEPWSHTFEYMNRGLVRETRLAGARVALNGHGGDFLFQCSPVFLADLLARGRFARLRKEWRAIPVRNSRGFILRAIEPLLPPWMLNLAASLRILSRVASYERPIPVWFNQTFVRQTGLVERAAAARPAGRWGKRVAAEMAWVLTAPHFGRVVSATGDFGLEEGVEVRMPLLDRRVVAFAASRPWWELFSGGQKKHLLRHAMRGLLPDSILGPRPFKTGSFGRYFERDTRSGLQRLLHLCDAPVLSEYGIIDRTRFRQMMEAYCQSTATGPDVRRVGLQLLCTVQAELWIRARLGQSDGERSEPRMPDAHRALTT